MAGDFKVDLPQIDTDLTVFLPSHVNVKNAALYRLVCRAPTRAKKVRDSSSFKPNILLGHLSFELEMVEQSDMACNINLMEIKWN